jgi:transcriptional regulator with XRE-family HTH domain
MEGKGYTLAEMADRLGVSASTVSNYINSEKDLITSKG